jgi:hypothetical protein
LKFEFDKVPLALVLFVFLIVLLGLVWVLESGRVVEPPVVSTTSTIITTTVSTVPEKSPSDLVLDDIMLIQDSVDSNNPQGCGMVDDPALALARDMCYYSIAFNTRNVSLCDKIVENHFREKCVVQVNEEIAFDRAIGGL